MKTNSIYNKEYAETWIKNYESGKDSFRVKYIHPTLKKYIQSLPKKANILDIGCGWGMVIEYISPSQKYTGIDPAKDFFTYIRKKFPNKEIILKEGCLPDKIPDSKFNVVICSMVLHTVKALSKSIKNMVNRLDKNGKMLIIEFDDKSEDFLRKSLTKKISENKNSIKGMVKLASGIEVNTDVVFHKEKEIEKELKKYGSIKKYRTHIYVVYEFTKK